MSFQTKNTREPLFLKDRKSSSMLNEAKGGDFMSDLEQVNDFQASLARYNGEVDQALSHARKVSIDSDDDASTSVALAGDLRKLSKKIDAIKKEITAPAREFTAKVNTLANGYIEKLDEAIDIISSKVGVYNHARIEAQMKALEQQAIIDAAAGVTTDYAIMPAKENTKTATASTYETSEWVIQVDDFSKIPQEYLMLNETLVRQAVKLGRDTIPGLKITEQKVTRIRAR
jgi:hypothetical protein